MRISPSFSSAAKDVVGGTNGYGGSLEMKRRLCCGSIEREYYRNSLSLNFLFMNILTLSGP